MSAKRVTRSSSVWTREERAVLDGLDSPEKVQAFLDRTPYSTEPIYRSPRSVLRDRRAHCFDGAMLAAAALRRLGHAPLLLDLRAVRDDDHVLCLYREGRHWGAVAKSNYVGLRSREPIYRSLRELALTYFEVYFNLQLEKSLRSYSVPVDLRRLDHLAWETDDSAMDEIAKRLDSARHLPLLTPAQVKRLRPVDQRTYDGNSLGVDMAGVYGAKEKQNG